MAARYDDQSFFAPVRFQISTELLDRLFITIAELSIGNQIFYDIGPWQFDQYP